LTGLKTAKVKVIVVETRTYISTIDYTDDVEITADRAKAKITERACEYKELFECGSIVDESWVVTDAFVYPGVNRG